MAPDPTSDVLEARKMSTTESFTQTLPATNGTRVFESNYTFLFRETWSAASSGGEVMRKFSSVEEVFKQGSGLIRFNNASSETSLLNYTDTFLRTPNETWEVFTKLHYIASCIIGVVFSLIGIPGNLIAFYVWSRKPMSSSTAQYVTFQSAVDVIVCCLYFVNEPLPFYYPDMLQKRSYGEYFSFFGSPFYSLFIFTSNWMIAATTTDRYFRLCRPTFAKSSSSRCRIAIFLSSSVALCFLMNGPFFFKFKPRLESYPVSQIKSYVKTILSMTSGYEMWEVWVHCWFLMTAPLFVTLTTSLLIRRRLDQITNSGVRLKSAKLQLTRMLLKTTLIYAARIAVQCITQCIVLVFVRDKKITGDLMAITKLGKIFNCSINVFIYLRCNPKFKKTLLDSFRKKRLRKSSLLWRNEHYNHSVQSTEIT